MWKNSETETYRQRQHVA